MRQAIYILFSLLGFYGCRSVPANRAVDAFVWQRLEADHDPDSARRMGRIDRETFRATVDDFPWREQAVAANRFRKNSPTLSVDDLFTDHSFFISSGIAEDGSDFGYFVGWVHPETKNNKPYRQVDTYSVEDAATLHELSDLFFNRDYPSLKRQLAGHPLILQSPERIGWNQYLIQKQAYFK
ncbi:MAG: hypothetical protein LIO68_07680 [Rikenellaceae bacterium]|nr:hypothetical protein [Rikenellaceae bacterium]